jgi:hypothetical protein
MKKVEVKTTKVFQEDMSIVWMKLLKGLGISALLTIIAWLSDLITNGSIPVKYTLLATISMAILQTILKGMQEYKKDI